jgi:hypothetical protein
LIIFTFNIEKLSEEQQEIVETASEVLYGLIHSRFILTTRGMQRMVNNYLLIYIVITYYLLLYIVITYYYLV